MPNIDHYDGDEIRHMYFLQDPRFDQGVGIAQFNLATADGNTRKCER